jgi:hypothetical protein
MRGQLQHLGPGIVLSAVLAALNHFFPLAI